MSQASHQDTVSVRQLLDVLQPQAKFAYGFVVTSLPRGGLQIAQPVNVSESALKSYSERLHTLDRLSWQALLSHHPVRLNQVGADGQPDLVFNEIAKPVGLHFGLAIPMSGPVLEGYPGAVVLLRTAEQGDFTDAELATLKETIERFEGQLGHARAEFRNGRAAGGFARPPVSMAVLDSQLKAHTPGTAWNNLDDSLRSQMVEQARRQFQSLNGHEVTVDRVNLPDSHGDQWAFNRITYRRYPALGDGPVTFFCLQPDCFDWSNVRSADLQADPELSRLMPAVKFMHAEYNRGPTLAEIAQQVKLSPFHFHRRFSELLGTTPKQYMLGCQIQQAKTELLAGQKELAQIAKDCGFAHQSHFTSRFKQATGLTPTRWRRMALRRESSVASNN